MGFRLCAEIKGYEWFYATKLYGYVKTDESLASLDFLKNKINIFGSEEGYKDFLDQCIDSHTDSYELSADDFRTFIELYNYDLNKHFGSGTYNLKEDPIMKKLLDDDRPKTIHWC